MQKQLLFDFGKNVQPFRAQLLKWIGNKQRFAHEIASFFPEKYNTYYEPFLGSGAVLGTLWPDKAVASDIFEPLTTIWKTLHDCPATLKKWYRERWEKVKGSEKIEGYEDIKASYNRSPNAADLLFLCRACYGGVVRFRKTDGFMSTPCGIHNPIHPDKFDDRVDLWKRRTEGTEFFRMDYREAMLKPREGDLVYCDPPYAHSQSILYGAQEFDIRELFDIIRKCKNLGVYVALSIDGRKGTDKNLCDLPIPKGLFEREIFVNCGPSMLKRFQMEGRSLEKHHVADRLLLTY